MNVNLVTLAGRLTRDIELRHTQGGTSLANLSLAINRRYKQGDEQKEEVTFVDVTAWGRQAEVLAEHLKKGDPLFLVGRLKLETWEDPQGGRRSKLSVTLESFQFLGGKQDPDDAPRSKPAPRRAEESNDAW